MKTYPPDLTLAEIGAPRESGFQGGVGRYIAWPEILPMWWNMRNPVSGRVPELYWPGCVPCHNKPSWSLASNNYQEPPTGPTSVTAYTTKSTAGGDTAIINVTVAGGLTEPVAGRVELRNDGAVVGTGVLDGNGNVAIHLDTPGMLNKPLVAVFLGSDRLKPGASRVVCLPN